MKCELRGMRLLEFRTKVALGTVLVCFIYKSQYFVTLLIFIRKFDMKSKCQWKKNQNMSVNIFFGLPPIIKLVVMPNPWKSLPGTWKSNHVLSLLLEARGRRGHTDDSRDHFLVVAFLFLSFSFLIFECYSKQNVFLKNRRCYEFNDGSFIKFGIKLYLVDFFKVEWSST